MPMYAMTTKIPSATKPVTPMTAYISASTRGAIDEASSGSPSQVIGIPSWASALPPACQGDVTSKADEREQTSGANRVHRREGVAARARVVVEAEKPCS